MRLQALALLGALTLAGPAFAADDAADVTPMRLVLTQNGHVVLAETLYVTDAPAHLRLGTENGYPVRTCAATQQTLTSVSLFAGWHVQVHRDPAGIQVHLVQHAVQTGQGAADAESFFQLLKRERVRQKIYLTREDARADVFDYIEMFYNGKRRHGASGGLAPVEYERRFRQSGVQSV